jgi:hypothetical protein
MGPGITPLRQRMLGDMHLRKFEPKIRTSSVRAARKKSELLGFSPDTATAEALRRIQLQLVDQGTSPFTPNSSLTE